MTPYRGAPCELRKAVAAIFFVTLAFLAAPLAAPAQQAGKISRIGYLSSGSTLPPAHLIGSVRDGLRELGWVDGQNYTIEYRGTEGRADRSPALLQELIQLKVDLLIVSGTPGALAAQAATRDIPIVFQMVSDPVTSGLVASLAHPGGNLTGWSNILPKTSGKLLQLLTETMPRVAQVAVLFSSANQGKVLEFQELQAAARPLGVTVRPAEAPAPRDLEAALAAMARRRPDAFITLADQITQPHQPQIVAFAATHRLPAIYQVRDFVDGGGLMSYGLDLVYQYRRTASYVDKILKGVKPADLPVEQPTKFEFIINLKTAKALGLTIPRSVLDRADEVIQ